jgi:Skp family chaperone for outer membrane proteins
MSEKSESNLNEMANVAGSGEGLALPPAFVMVNPKKHRKYKKGNDKIDGRTSGARALFNRIQRRKMKEQFETQIDEAIVSDTERAQKQISQQKKLGRQKDLQNKRKEAKEKLMSKTKEMDTLMKARLSDFKKKASEQQKKVQKNSVEFEGNVMMEGQDVIQVALDVATSELNPSGEGSFAKIQFSDGGVQNLDNFSAKRIAACYAQLDDEHKQQFQYLLNKIPSV